MSKTGALLTTATTVALLILVQPLRAIGPTVVMFYGDPLKQPVFVTGADAGTFGDLLHASTVPASATEGRVAIKAALFWGTADDPSGKGVRDVTQLKPEMAWQHGRFFAPTAAQPALLLVTPFATKGAVGAAPDNAASFSWGGIVPPAAVAVLQRLGVVKAAK